MRYSYWSRCFQLLSTKNSSNYLLSEFNSASFHFSFFPLSIDIKYVLIILFLLKFFRFTNQTQIRDGTCGVCQSQISRSSQCSSCTQCKILAHPKCAIIAPKTCGLPQGLVKHYAKSVVKSNSNDDSPVKGGEGEHQGPTAVEGWVKLLKCVFCHCLRIAPSHTSRFMVHFCL